MDRCPPLDTSEAHDERTSRNAGRDQCRGAAFAASEEDQATEREIGDLSPKQLHRMRIQIKKVRYAAEFFSSVYQGKKAAKRCETFLSSLKQLQNCLGGFNDIMTRKTLCGGYHRSSGARFDRGAKPPSRFAAGLSWATSRCRFQNCSIVRARRIPASIAPRHSGSDRTGTALLAQRPLKVPDMRNAD